MLGFYWDSGRIAQSVKCTQADKFLLAARSEYFERMLRTGMSEADRSEHRDQVSEGYR